MAHFQSLDIFSSSYIEVVHLHSKILI